MPSDRAPAPLIGRDSELEELLDLVAPADPSARRGAVVLAGDAGVGKTRLLGEVEAKAASRGTRVLVGHCVDLGDSALSYLPFSEVFGRLAAEDPSAADRLVELRPAIQRLLPGARLLSGTDEQAAAHHIQRSDLFEAVHTALEWLAATAPLLVVIEDVHWADQSTRDILSYLFARQFTQAVSLVASYRADALHRRHPLRTAAGEWSRLPGVTRMQLAPLGDAEVRRLVNTLHRGPMREADVQAIIDRADGNAFFAEELVLAADASALPADLADLLLVRLDRLGDDERLVVRAASVAGRRVSHELLTRVVGFDDGARLDAALRSVTDANVLVERDAGAYTFRHALLAEAVYDDLLPGERTRLHRAYADALSSGVAGTAADLARHARAANDVATALRASIDAADDAGRVGGPDEAAAHFQRALELAAEDPGALVDAPLTLVDLTIRASEAVTTAGHPYRAVALVQEQLDHLRDAVSDEERVRLLLALAVPALVSDVNLWPLDATTEALQLIDADPPTAL